MAADSSPFSILFASLLLVTISLANPTVHTNHEEQIPLEQQLSRVTRAIIINNCPVRCTRENESISSSSSSSGTTGSEILQSFPLPAVICSRQNMTRAPDGIPEDTKKLDLSWNNISTVQPNSLGHLYQLQELSLKGNELESIDSSAFSNLTRLKELTLARNKLTSVPPSEALPQSLEILDLEHNRIARVEGRVLARNGRIRALRLGHNLIEHIAPDAFEFLSSLTILELNNNKLTVVPAEALQKLPNLQELSLAHNQITSIDVPFHATTPRIVLLQVKDNPIEHIHADGFSHLHHLKKLILYNVPNLTFPHLNGTTSLEVLRIDRCPLLSVPDNLCAFTPNLKSLDLKLTKLRRLPRLSDCTELRILDLNSNEITEIEAGSMEGLGELHDLHMQKNRIERLENDSLRGLSNLRVLDLCINTIEHIDAGAFLHSPKLQDLNLNDNLFPFLPPAGLDRLLELKTHNNPNLKEFPGPEYFTNVRRLMVAYACHCCQFMGMRGSGSDDIKDFVLYPTENDFGNALDALNWSWPGFVNLTNRVELANDFWQKFETSDGPTGGSSLSPADDLGGDGGGIFGGGAVGSSKYRPPRANEIVCTPRPVPFLPCTDLFDWWTLRCGVWIVFLLALMGNGTVVFVLIFARTKMDVPRFLVCNLAVADFFMGVYLGFLAVVDAATLGEFRRFAIKWQLSSACQIAGFFGVLSSELSVFTLAVITMERHYAITHAVHLNKRLSLRHASYIMVIGWIFALIMAVLPLFGISNYRKFAVCLPFETENSASMSYVVFLMFANGVAFTILMGCYLKMYCSIRGSQAWNSNDTRIAKRMALLVFTDLLCWFPIAFFSLTAVFGWQLVSLEEAKVFTVFILPLNSCCNPFLYAILTKQFKKDCVLICKAIEESRVTSGIGRCRHSSNFSNRQTAPNTGSLTEKSSKDGQPCICHSGLHPNGGDVNGNAKYRFIHSPERLRAMVPLGRFFSRYILCQDPTKDSRQKEEDYRMRNVRRYLYNATQTNYPPDANDGKHQRHASVSSGNFSSSRSDSWRVQNRCGIPLRMIEPRRRNSWAVTRKPSQDSNLSSSRNDSSATSNSTATWRLSRSSVSSDAASHSEGGKSSFKRISTGGAAGANGGGGSGGVLRPGGGKNTLPTSTAAVAAAAAAAAVATGSAAATDLGAIAAASPALLGVAAAAATQGMNSITATNSEEEMDPLSRSNTIKNQNPPPLIPGPPPQISRRTSLTAVTSSAPINTKAKGLGGSTKKKKKKRVKIKKPPKKKEITIISRPSGSSGGGVQKDIDNDDEIDDEEASAKIATNRPRLVRQSAFFSEEVVIEPEVCPVHGPLNPGTYDDEDDDDDAVSDVDNDDDSEEDDDEEEEEDAVDEENMVGGPPSHHSIHSIGSGIAGGVICEEDEDEDIEDPTSPILRANGGGGQMAGIALVIVPRRLSTVRSRDAVAEHEQQVFIRSSGSSNSINNQVGGGGSPLSISPSNPTGGNISPSSSSVPGGVASQYHQQQQQHSSTNSPTALLLPAGMAHFGRRKMYEQPVKFYVVPATTGLLTSAKWHSMSHVDGGNGGGTSPTASGSSPNQQRHHYHSPHQQQHSPGGSLGGGSSPNYPSSPSSLRSQHGQQHSRSHSPRQFPKHDTARRLSSSIAETAEDTIPLNSQVDQDNEGQHSNATSPFQQQQPPKPFSQMQRDALLNERRVSFQLPGINLPSTSSSSAATQATRSNSPPERISHPSSSNSSARRASNS